MDFPTFYFKGVGNKSIEPRMPMLAVDPQEPSYEWDCKPCSFEQPKNQEGRSWGFYDDIPFGCEACKEKCNEDEKCIGVLDNNCNNSRGPFRLCTNRFVTSSKTHANSCIFEKKQTTGT